MESGEQFVTIPGVSPMRKLYAGSFYLVVLGKPLVMENWERVKSRSLFGYRW